MQATEKDNILHAAGRGNEFIRVRVPFIIAVLSVALHWAALIGALVVPLFIIEDVQDYSLYVQRFVLLATASVLALHFSHHLPFTWLCSALDTSYGGEGGILAQYYTVWRNGFRTFTLVRCLHPVTFTDKLRRTILSNLWMLLALVFGFLLPFPDMRNAAINRERIAAAAYDTLQARQFEVEGVSFTMVYVQGGTYTMGATPDQRFTKKERKEYGSRQAVVTVSSFHIGRTEVTNELWDAVMGVTSGNNQQMPRTNITWTEACFFAARLSELTGETFRLPTHAEWEWAARGGVHTHRYQYSGSNDASKVAWFDKDEPKKVGTVTWANELGIFDMSGNVAEWLLDVASQDAVHIGGTTDPVVADFPTDDSGNRIVAGGFYCFEEIYCRPSVVRVFDRERDTYDHIGMRLVLIPKERALPIPGVYALTYASPGTSGGTFSLNNLPSVLQTGNVVAIQEVLLPKEEPSILSEPASIPLPEVQPAPAETKSSPSSLVAVDLGLSVKWASANLGTPQPTGIGNYYAWGALEPVNSSGAAASPLTASQPLRITGGKYDAARALLGGKWRMPTMSEQRELINKCKWEHCTMSGVPGARITGPNNQSIFLPAAGYAYMGKVRNQGTHCYYWAGETQDGFAADAIQLFYTDQDYSQPRQDFRDRTVGLPIRPVMSR